MGLGADSCWGTTNVKIVKIVKTNLKSNLEGVMIYRENIQLIFRFINNSQFAKEKIIL